MTNLNGSVGWVYTGSKTQVQQVWPELYRYVNMNPLTRRCILLSYIHCSLTHSLTDRCRNLHTHTHTRTCTCTHTHSHTHTHTRMCTHTHTLSLSLQVLLQLARGLFEETTSLEAMMQKVMLESLELIPCERCTVLLIDQEKQEVDSSLSALSLPPRLLGYFISCMHTHT